MVRIFMYYFWKYVPLMYILLSYSLLMVLCLMDAPTTMAVVIKCSGIFISFIMLIVFYNMAISMWRNK